jgi:large subunit ribosomal protein L29
MELKDIRALADDDIVSKLDDAREELFKLRFQFRTGQLKDYSRLSATRRSIARLQTVARERQIAAKLMAGEKK